MQLRRPRNPGRVAIVAGGLLIAVNLVVAAALATDTAPPRGSLPTSVERVFPEDGSVIRPQETISVDLRDDLDGRLVIDGRAIPPDQLVRDPGLGIVQFRPGPGKEIRELEPGRHTAEVRYWPDTMTEEQAERAGRVGTYGWRFSVG